jgi:hypothetical protein
VCRSGVRQSSAVKQRLRAEARETPRQLLAASQRDVLVLADGRALRDAGDGVQLK